MEPESKLEIPVWMMNPPPNASSPNKADSFAFIRRDRPSPSQPFGAILGGRSSSTALGNRVKHRSEASARAA